MKEKRELSEQYRRIFQDVPVGLYLSTPSGRVEQVNAALVEILGYPDPQTLLATNARDLYPNPEDRAQWQSILQREGVIYDYEMALRRYDGRIIWVRHTARAIRDAQGQVVGYAGAVQDITEQYADLLARARAEEEANAAAQENERLIATLEERVRARTHELATLLDISQQVASMLGLDPLLDLILTQLQSVVPYDGASILTLDGKVLNIRAYRGPIPQAQALAHHFHLEQARPDREVVLGGKPVIIPDVRGETPIALAFRQTTGDELETTYGYIRSWMGVPLLAKGQAIGMLSLDHNRPDFYTARHAELAWAFADQAAVALENARLRAQAEQAAAAAERTRLARDLHDSVTQLLYSLALQAEAGRGKAERGEVKRVQEHLTEIAETAQQALKEMRLLVHELRPLVLEREGLVSTLNQRLDAVERRAGIEAHLVTEKWSPVPTPIEEELYYIARETLNNSLKHAAATSVTVQLRRTDSRAELKISNNGRSFDPVLAREGGGLGMKSMLERTEKLGGQLTIQSAPGEGTVVTVQVPVP